MAAGTPFRERRLSGEEWGEYYNSWFLSLLCSSATCQCPFTGSRRNSSLTQPCRVCSTELGKPDFSEKL